MHEEEPRVERPWVIYVLIDPRPEKQANCGGVRYVGKSFTHRRRFNLHRWEAKNRTDRKARWFASLTKLGLEPLVHLIEHGAGETTWQEAEVRWIAHYRALGADLVNMTDGGEGGRGCRPSPETIAKRVAKLRGKKRTPEQVARITAPHRGSKRSPEACVRMSVAQFARPPRSRWEGPRLPPKTRREITPEVRAQQLATRETRRAERRALGLPDWNAAPHPKMRGQKRDPAAVAITAEKNRGKKRTHEQCERMGASKRGVKRTAEQRERIRQGTIAAHARKRVRQSDD